MRERPWRVAWIATLGLALVSRVWNALGMTVLRGFDATGHVSYVLFLDLYRAVPYADQGWSYFHPPLHYLFGWLLAQAGDAQVLVRGLALVVSAASLLIAALAGLVVRLAMPGRPGLALLAFGGVAFLPVHVYSSKMPGNELTTALFASAAVAVFLWGEVRAQRTLATDAAAGLLAGLALLSKFSGLLCLLAIAASLAWQALRRPDRDLAGAVRRIALVAGVALLVCSPYYARNVAEFGTPFRLSRDLPMVAEVETAQPPGARGWRDLLRFPLRTFSDPDPEAEHLLHAVPASLFVSTWLDTRPDVEAPFPRIQVAAGVVPTALALLGLLLCLRAALAGRDPVATTLAFLAVGSVGAMLVMAFRVPTFAMLKASYLLGASLAYGFCLARGVAALTRRLQAVAAALVALSALVAVAASTPGGWLPWRGENPAIVPVYAHFGQHERAVAHLQDAARRAKRTEVMREHLANALVEAGEYAAAVEAYRGRRRLTANPPLLEPIDSPWVMNRLAVATALAGDASEARALLDSALARSRHAPLLVNRAALRAREGDLDGAERDLRAALDLEPDNAAAWRVLAFVQQRRGDPEAEATLEEARRRALAPPRGFPYGVGNGFHLNAHRFMLVIEDGELALYRPARSRTSPDR